MHRTNKGKTRIRDTGDSLPRTSNNAFAKKRDQAAWAWLDVHPSTPRQLVEAGLYPNEVKARQRLKAAERRGKVRFIGLVNLFGYDEKVRARFAVNKPQHEAELTELCLRFLKMPKVKEIRRGLHVDGLLADMEIEFDDTVYGEHDRSTMSYGELLQRIKGYSDCGRDVLWSMYTQTRIDGIIGYARKHGFELPPSIWFTTYEKALADIAGPWTNAYGEQTTL
jgi:hypothetical protein